MKDYNLRSIFLILILFSGQLHGQEKYQPIEIKSKTDYTHLSSKVVFPLFLHGFSRSKIVVYDKKHHNVGASYQMRIDKKNTTVSVYVYPADVSNDNLREQFVSFNYAVNQNATKAQLLKPEFVKINSGSIVLNGLKTVFNYNLTVPDFMKGQKEQVNRSLFSLYDCGQWNLKIRITSQNQNDTQLLQLEKLFLTSLNPLKIAEEFKLDTERAPNIVISKTAQRDSLMQNSIIAEARAKIDWFGEHKTQGELATGLSDLEVGSHEFAIAEKMKFYYENKEKLPTSIETTAYFENLQKIIDNGFIRDHIWSQTVGIVEFPEGEARRLLYDEFLKVNNIPEEVDESMYRIFY